jgi:hypothetical protein
MKSVFQKSLPFLIAVLSFSACEMCREGDDSCQARDQAPPAMTVEGPESLHLERGFQRVIAYGIREVKTANALIAIRLRNNKQRIDSMSCHNLTTNSSQGWGWGVSNFYVDISRAALAMNVQVGDNEIECAYYHQPDCDTRTGVCPDKEHVHTGRVILPVTFAEVTYDGYREDRPSATDCAE